MNRLSHGTSRLLRLSAAILILILLAYFIDVGDAISYLEKLDLYWLIPAFLVIQAQVVLSALRWKITANRLGQSLTTMRAVTEYYLATIANLSLPGGVTGDAARVYRNRQSGALGTAFQGVVLERLAGQLSLLLIVIVGWVLWPLLMPGSVPDFFFRTLGTTVLLIAVLALVFCLVLKLAPERITRALVDFGPALHTAWLVDRQWIVQGVLSIAIVTTYLLVFLFCSIALDAALSLPALLTVVPLVLLSMLIPLSIGGWGIREASAAILWPVAGLSSEAGIATSIVYALVSLFGCIPGMVLWVLQSKR